jgi:hypothetical protein
MSDHEEDKESPYIIRMSEDNRKGLITSEGDQANAFLKRFHLQPFHNNLRLKTIEEEEGESNGQSR